MALHLGLLQLLAQPLEVRAEPLLLEHLLLVMAQAPMQLALLALLEAQAFKTMELREVLQLCITLLVAAAALVDRKQTIFE